MNKREVQWDLHERYRALTALRSAAALLVALAVLGASPARAGTVTIACNGNTAADTAEFETLAGCSNPCAPTDNIVITDSSCTPDFGTRLFNNKGKITVPNGGTFTVNAGQIVVDAKIAGKHTKDTEGNASHVTLTAAGLGTDSDITINKKVNVSGRFTSGSIALEADGDISLNHQLIARGQGGSAPTATGGTITVHADGTVSSVKRGKIVVRGKKKVTQAGVADISGDLGLDLKGRVEARGLYGGSVSATSSAGNVNIEEEIRAYGEFGSGGTVDIETPNGNITIGGKKGTIKAQGGAPSGGGTVTLNAGGSIDAQKSMRVKGLASMPGGVIDVNADNGDVLLGNLLVTGNPGGSIDVASQTGDIELEVRADASSKDGDGGHVGMVAAGGNVTIDGSVYVNTGKTVGNGGDIILQANGTALKMGTSHSKFDATGSVNGGTIDGICTAGNIEANGAFTATGGTMDGCIGLQDADSTPTGTATFDPAFQTTMCP